MGTITGSMRMSIAAKFNLLTISLLLVTSLSTALFQVHQAREESYEELVNHGLTVATMVAQNSEYGLYAEDRESLTALLRSLFADQLVAYAAIRNVQGEVLVREGLVIRGLTDADSLAVSGRSEAAWRDAVDPEGGKAFFDLQLPVRSSLSGSSALFPEAGATELVLGSVQLGLSKEGIQERVRSVLVSALTFMSIAVVLGAFLTVLMSRRLTAPLHRLAMAARGVAEGRLEAPLPIDNRDEVGELAGLFSQMIERLREFRGREKEYQRNLEHLAYHDGLTGLANRVLFLDRLEQGLAQAKRHERAAALLFIDLDRFKQVNDAYGHQVGDLLLIECGERLRSSLRCSDAIAQGSGESGFVSRLAGDEFTVWLPELDHPEDAAKVARRIVSALSRPVSIQGCEMTVTASVGISLFPLDGEEGEALLQHADTAMYHAKKSGRNRFSYFQESLNTETWKLLALENDLRRALQNDELLLHFQPQIDIATQQIFGVEALIRWQHPEQGLLFPGVFLPVALDSGLIYAVNDWVVRQACKQIRRWDCQGLPPVGVAINLSGYRLDQQNLVERLNTILEEADGRAERLTLEITETATMENFEASVKIMHRLQEMGFKIAIDDFGTGYSSLSRMKNLPFDTLKIDRSFISQVTSSPSDAAIVKALVEIAASLEVEVIAEGVENVEQLNLLGTLGCTRFQGFYYSRPLPPEEVGALLRQGNGGVKQGVPQTLSVPSD